MNSRETPADQLRNMGAAVDVEYWQTEAKNITRLADWEKLQDINTRLDREIKTQGRKYHQNFEKRLVMACEHIAGLRGARFDKLQRGKDPRSQQLTKLIQKAAKRDVETDHHRRLSAIHERHATELRDLVETARARESGPDGPQKFLTDGRDEPDRKMPPRKR
jgi:hypothetical protein